MLISCYSILYLAVLQIALQLFHGGVWENAWCLEAQKRDNVVSLRENSRDISCEMSIVYNYLYTVCGYLWGSPPWKFFQDILDMFMLFLHTFWFTFPEFCRLYPIYLDHWRLWGANFEVFGGAKAVAQIPRGDGKRTAVELQPTRAWGKKRGFCKHIISKAHGVRSHFKDFALFLCLKINWLCVIGPVIFCTKNGKKGEKKTLNRRLYSEGCSHQGAGGNPEIFQLSINGHLGKKWGGYEMMVYRYPIGSMYGLYGMYIYIYISTLIPQKSTIHV